VAGPWKKTDENPLDSGAYCHLLVFPIVPLIRTLRGSLDTIAADVSMASRIPPLTRIKDNSPSSTASARYPECDASEGLLGDPPRRLPSHDLFNGCGFLFDFSDFWSGKRIRKTDRN
jgi:hypothetical protein